jgi:hypothetical protein
MLVSRTSPQRTSLVLILLVGVVGAGRAEERPRPQNDAAIPSVRDSLVATSEDGVEVWFTLSRVGHAPDGISCVERGLEIRRGGTRIQVPLLYTGAPPVLIDRSTLRAELWNHCRPVDTYRVDLRSGRPLRERSGSPR